MPGNTTKTSTPVRRRSRPLFDIVGNGSTPVRELIAGLSMFLATAYTVVVIPGMLEDAGLPVAAITTCVITVIILGTAAMGVFGNLPMVLAPGLGGVSLVAYTLVLDGQIEYPVAMGMVFWSGVVFLLLTLFGIRSLVTRIIPASIRLAIGPAIGLFIAFVGFRSAGLVVPGKSSLKLGDLGSPAALLTLAAVVVLIALVARRVPGAFIIVIVAATLVGIPLGLTQLHGSAFSLPQFDGSLLFHIDLVTSLSPHYLPYLFAFFASEFFSTTGVIMTVTDHLGRAKHPGSPALVDPKRAFLVDSSTIIGGSLFGAPSVTTYAESTAGAEAGGRTGASSLWTAACFLVLLFATPLAAAIPAAATAPVVIVVGLKILSGFRRISTDDLTELIPAAMVLACTIFWGNFGTGIAAGLLCFVLVKVLAGKWRDVHPGMWVMAPFLVYFFIAVA
ncbi:MULTISPECIES: NCS2 family permease [unclassified Pseudoclavibacter]|uniref:NCS2 family permease n=1 Tax=unclassified Pseudoclavibacter TaxID=2615177 RepID=UPI001300D470|nr:MULTISPECIES: NCS2 family permease [unclassified Pseudoclavibacter]KAB1656964.1 NCS2 family permease [Pseudoclavibacter sp. CFCC 11306]KAB1659778.1 NCS2 family permease [Pseudoclavibacter sp. CFCC 13796]